MDLTQLQETNNPLSLVASGSQNEYGEVLINQMSQDDLNNIAANNADLRKKLRVDRIRKQTMGVQASNVGGNHAPLSGNGGKLASMMFTIEDPSQPDWLKLKSLREIEVFRESKKHDIIKRVMDQ